MVYPVKLIKIQSKCSFRECNVMIEVYSPKGKPVSIKCTQHALVAKSNKFKEKLRQMNEYKELKLLNLLDTEDYETSGL